MRFLFLLFFLFVVSGAEEFKIDSIVSEKISSVDENLPPQPYHLSFSFTSQGAPSISDETNKLLYNIPSILVGFEKQRSSYIFQWYGGFGYGVSRRTIFVGEEQDKIRAYVIDAGLSVRRYFFSDEKHGLYPILGLNHKSAREFHHEIRPDGNTVLKKYKYSFFSSFLGAGYTFNFKTLTALHIQSSLECKAFFKNRDFRNLGVFVKLEIGY